MSDRSYVKLDLRATGDADPEELADTLGEWLTHDPDSTDPLLGEWTADELALGTLDEEIHDALRRVAPAATWAGWQDPKYEAGGSFVAYAPELGSFFAGCDGEGELTFSPRQIRELAALPDDERERRLGTPWLDALKHDSRHATSAYASHDRGMCIESTCAPAVSTWRVTLVYHDHDENTAPPTSPDYWTVCPRLIDVIGERFDDLAMDRARELADEHGCHRMHYGRSAVPIAPAPAPAAAEPDPLAELVSRAEELGERFRDLGDGTLLSLTSAQLDAIDGLGDALERVRTARAGEAVAR